MSSPFTPMPGNELHYLSHTATTRRQPWLVGIGSPLRVRSRPKAALCISEEGTGDAQASRDSGRRTRFWLGKEVCIALH